MSRSPQSAHHARLHRRLCLHCGHAGPALQAASTPLRCPQCGGDLYSRPPRSYAQLEGLDRLDAPQAEPADERAVAGRPAGPASARHARFGSEPPDRPGPAASGRAGPEVAPVRRAWPQRLLAFLTALFSPRRRWSAAIFGLARATMRRANASPAQPPQASPTGLTPIWPTAGTDRLGGSSPDATLPVSRPAPRRHTPAPPASEPDDRPSR